jgi:hypothetical protein
VVIITVRGRITTAVGDEIMQRSLQAMRQHASHRLLHDLRRARIAESTLQIINRPRKADEMGIPANMRLALLCSVLTTDHEMLVNMAHARGQALRAFTDGAVARAWLKSA